MCYQVIYILVSYCHFRAFSLLSYSSSFQAVYAGLGRSFHTHTHTPMNLLCENAALWTLCRSIRSNKNNLLFLVFELARRVQKFLSNSYHDVKNFYSL